MEAASLNFLDVIQNNTVPVKLVDNSSVPVNLVALLTSPTTALPIIKTNTVWVSDVQQSSTSSEIFSVTMGAMLVIIMFLFMLRWCFDSRMRFLGAVQGFRRPVAADTTPPEPPIDPNVIVNVPVLRDMDDIIAQSEEISIVPVKQPNEISIKQPNEISIVKQPNEVSIVKQPNEISIVKQPNEISIVKQPSEISIVPVKQIKKKNEFKHARR